MKRTRIIFMAALLCILAATTAFAEGVLKIEKTSARPGDEVSVDITLSADEEINSIGIRDIEYDDSELTFIGFDDYDEIRGKTDLCSFDNKLGACVIGLEEAEAFDGKICTLVFEVSDDAEEGVYRIDAAVTLKLDSEVVESRSIVGSIEVKYEIAGDLNLDESVDINDAILLLQHSMFPELYPIDYKGSVDFTRDGSVDINDAILLLQYSMFPDLYPLEEEEDDRDFTDGVTINPRGSSGDVELDTEIVFTFPEKVYTDDEEELTSHYIEAVLDFRKDSKTGEELIFEATISDDGTIITIVPDRGLEYSTKYYATFPEGVLTYADGTSNQGFGTIFTTKAPDMFENLIIPTHLTLDGEEAIANGDVVSRYPKEAFDAIAGKVWYIYAWVDGKMKYVPVVTEDVQPKLIVDGEITEEYLDKLCTFTIDEDGMYTIKSLGYDVNDVDTDIYEGVNKDGLEEAGYSNYDEFEGSDALNNKNEEDLQLYVDGKEGTIVKIVGSRFNIPGFDRYVDFKDYTKIIIRVWDEDDGEFTYVEYDASTFKLSLDDDVVLTNVSYIVSNNPDSKSRENLVLLYAETDDLCFKGVRDEDEDRVIPEYRIVSDYTPGDDEDGLWRFYYDLYNPFTGEKVLGVPGTNAEEKASVLNDAGAIEVGSIIELEDGLVNDEMATFNKGFVSADDLVYITEVDEAEGFFAVADYNVVTDNGTIECKDCVKDAVDDFDGTVYDFVTHAPIVDGNANDTTFIEYDENTAFAVITRSYKFEEINHWADGKMSPTTIEAIADAEKNLLCYNDLAKDRNGRYVTGYAPYVKAYVAVADESEPDELPVADFVIVIVNKDEAAALGSGEDYCGNSDH